MNENEKTSDKQDQEQKANAKSSQNAGTEGINMQKELDGFVRQVSTNILNLKIQAMKLRSYTSLFKDRKNAQRIKQTRKLLSQQYNLLSNGNKLSSLLNNFSDIQSKYQEQIEALRKSAEEEQAKVEENLAEVQKAKNTVKEDSNG